MTFKSGSAVMKGVSGKKCVCAQPGEMEEERHLNQTVSGQFQQVNCFGANFIGPKQLKLEIS